MWWDFERLWRGFINNDRKNPHQGHGTAGIARSERNIWAKMKKKRRAKNKLSKQAKKKNRR